MKDEEELLRAVWFTEAELNEGGSESQGVEKTLESFKKGSDVEENGWLPISGGAGLVWLEDNLKGGLDTGQKEEEEDAEILSFPTKILDGWKPSESKEDEDGQRNAILDQEWEVGGRRDGKEEKYESKVVTLKPQIFLHHISPDVLAGASEGLNRKNMGRSLPQFEH